MAERRMFAKTIIDSDAFLDMPLSAQALYFHLSMRADDDGFINNPKKIQRMVGASDDDCKLLIMKKFIITFESGVIVIKHWKIHNYIRNDRYKETVYQEEKSMLMEKENKSYSLGIPNGYQLDTQVSIGKDSLDKVSIGKDSTEEPKKRFTKPTLEEVQAYCQERNNDVDAKAFFDYYNAGDWKDAKGKPVRNWKQKVITWERSNNNGNAKSSNRKSKPIVQQYADEC